jgi:hypothetical protein
MNPSSLIGLINQRSRRRGIEIGRIDIRPSWSSVQVEQAHAEQAARQLHGFTYRGRKVHARTDGGAVRNAPGRQKA